MGTSLLLGEICLSAGKQEVPLFPSLRAPHTTSLASQLNSRSPCGHLARIGTCLLYPATSPPLLQTPGPAAFPKVELDIYKKKAPMYTMGTKSGLGGEKTVKPGPADYCLGKVRQPALSSSACQQPALKHLPLLTGLLRTQDRLFKNKAPRSPVFLLTFLLPGDADQAPGTCSHFWTPSFPLHHSSNIFDRTLIKQRTPKDLACLPSSVGRGAVHE